ncbi:hypothetical protein BDN67DRAFT_6153 [Paxillus ammoniavirescens]|nr:hypothetical protein BDN67DRAFT_6153 [Paxillus ammoniavirescens]
MEAQPTVMPLPSCSNLSIDLHQTEGSSPLAIAARTAGEVIPPPFIRIIDATPQKSFVVSSSAGSTMSTSATASGSGTATDSLYRLLYRGALSLPDSYLLLDGLTFSARLPSHLPSAMYDSPSHSLSQSDSFARDLMHNPLALTLESMRGRPSLRLKGTVYLKDVWIDDAGEVYMDIHPFATLSRVYFENILCLSPFIPASHDMYGPKRTEVGVRVSLGDTDGPETTEIIIYGEADTLLCSPRFSSAAPSSESSGSPPLTIRVARITPTPRPPRPDDPTPRKPPAHLYGGSAIRELGANKRIKPQSISGKDKAKANKRDENDIVRRAREVMLHLPGSKAPVNGRAKANDKSMESIADKTKQKSHGKGQPSSKDSVFKVPELPAKARRRQEDAGTDVFGIVEPPLTSTNGSSAKGKGKAKDTDLDDEDGESSTEATNKIVLKKSAVRHLANVGISRTHPEFKDLFGFVYRGAAFALRAQIKTSQPSTQAVEAITEAHVKLYVLTPDTQEAGTSGRGRGALHRTTSSFEADSWE